MESYEPEWGFLNLNLHTDHMGVVLHEDSGSLYQGALHRGLTEAASPRLHS